MRIGNAIAGQYGSKFEVACSIVEMKIVCPLFYDLLRLLYYG